MTARQARRILDGQINDMDESLEFIFRLVESQSKAGHDFLYVKMSNRIKEKLVTLGYPIYKQENDYRVEW